MTENLEASSENKQEKKKLKVIYTGLFVDDQGGLEKEFEPVHSKKFYHHVTIEFKPKDGLEGIEVGKKQEIKVIGRVTNEEVDAIIVECSKSGNENPHITLSVAEGISPKKSNDVIIEAKANGTVIPVDGVVISVTEGYFAKGKAVTELSDD
jgi:hypothetical protein